MRPLHVKLHRSGALGGASGLRALATASFTPRGPGYDPRARLQRRFVALRGGVDAIVVAFSWVDRAVRVKVLARGACSSDEVDRAFVTARGIAALDDDPSEFLAMARGHAVLGPLTRRIDPRIGSTPTVFESFAVAVIEQLVTFVEARAAIRRLWKLVGEPVPDADLRAAPTGLAVARVPMWQLHAIGVGSRRALTLHEGARRAEALERLRAHPPEVALEKLQSLRGVGPWTANAVARSGFGWADAVPVGDFHAPYTVTAALGGRDDLTRDDPKGADAAMLEVLEPFRPHRARVAMLLERQAVSERRWRPPRVDPHRREPWRY
ncbi:MAG: DNA-3-methyladenine glycosylase 2 family protein [Labilithrix sp.]|nr:DNA-3-methyladenine glycosylase 2 family protein [Labilithrix sp.]